MPPKNCLDDLFKNAKVYLIPIDDWDMTQDGLITKVWPPRKPKHDIDRKITEQINK